MSDSWLDDGDSEAIDLFGGEESAEDYLDDGDDAESYDDEEEAASPAVRRRRAKARQLALRRRRLEALARARNQRARRRRGPVHTAQKAVRQTQVAVRDLNLDSAMKSALQRQSNRITRSDYTTLATAALSQFQQSFPQVVGSGPYTQAALRFAPLVFLSSEERGSGAMAIVRDPRVIGGLLIAGLAIAGDRLRPKQVQRIAVPNVPTIVAGRQSLLTADAQDENGKRIDRTVFTWESSNDAVAKVSPLSGPTTNVIGVSAGTAVITATSAGVRQQIPIEVESIIRKVEISGTAKIAVKGEMMFIADALDDRGRSIDGVVFAWESRDPKIAKVDPITGKVTGVSAGPVLITAKSDGVPGRKTVEVA
ncbi:Ig-like domain-containing protein [Nonomuraea sp. NPDC049141]|uniref:Ig-like domain-containing protein n=1 Tax=Nonomuraea sp. NPDC049141 TaxID=3155500 RepID=UPI0033E3F79F